MGFQLVYYAYFLSYKTLRIFLAALSGFMYFRMNNLHKEDMNFKKIVAVDETLLNEAALKQLKTIGEEVVVYHDFPTEEEEVSAVLAMPIACWYLSVRLSVGLCWMLVRISVI